MFARINRIFNPFTIVPYRKVVRTDTGLKFDQADYLPHSRTLHTSFLEKFWDTYLVFRGDTTSAIKSKDTFYFDWDVRLGIFDYFTLSVGRFLDLLMTLFLMPAVYIARHVGKFQNENKWYAVIPLVLIGLLALAPAFLLVWPCHFIMNALIRPAAAFVLTLLCLPAIGLAWGISEIIRKHKAGKIASMPIEDETEKPKTSATTLRTLFGNNKISMRHDVFSFFKEEGKENSYQLKLNHTVNKDVSWSYVAKFSFSKDQAVKLADKLAEVNPSVYQKQAKYYCS